MKPIKFTIEKKLAGKLGRAGILETPHGSINTPAFVTVGTKATVKAMTPKQVKDLGAEVVLANTYHLYLQPGDKIVRDAGGLHKFMNWNGPTMTDSGGFQAFSLGTAFGESVSKIAKAREQIYLGVQPPSKSGERLAKVTEDGVEFRSHIDGSTHFFTPEKSIAIQHNIGADMIFAFDECTSPHALYEYQKEALARTHRWAKRSLDAHKNLSISEGSTFGTPKVEPSEDRNTTQKQGLFGIVQGGRFEDLRKESARFIGKMDFDGFGIGGSFDKEDMYSVVAWVNALLPEEKPRHLLGIGDPADLFGGIENGCDLFDCVAPTRIARNGTLYAHGGKINIFNARFVRDFFPIDAECKCYTCEHYTRAYLAHLFRAKEMFAGTLASIHNLHFIVNLVKKIRQSILNGNFEDYKQGFLRRYQKFA